MQDDMKKFADSILVIFNNKETELGVSGYTEGAKAIAEVREEISAYITEASGRCNENKPILQQGLPVSNENKPIITHTASADETPFGIKSDKFTCACGCDTFTFKPQPNNPKVVGIYCVSCGKWLKWADKKEKQIYEQNKGGLYVHT